MKVLCRAVVIVAMSASVAVCADAPSEDIEPRDAMRGGRLMPPALLECARNDLTSYTGLVIVYGRTAESVTVVIRTDAETTEKVEVLYANIVAAMLLNGAPFTDDDWRKIESKSGVLMPEMRVTAWVCLDGKTGPVLDWRPE